MQVSEDFKSIFGRGLKLKGHKIYVNEDGYRQNSTGIILNVRILDCEDLKLRIEILIDHGRIWIKVINGNESPDFKEIVERIERLKNLEGLTEYKKLNEYIIDK